MSRYFKYLTIIILLYCTVLCNAQEKPLQISLNTIKTELKKGAIGYGIKYLKTEDSLFKVQDLFGAKENYLYQFTPQFLIQSGNEDAFSAITAKISGIFMFFHQTTIAGLVTPNTSRGFQTFPISAGIETNNMFNIVNCILEAGWVPWYQTVGNSHTPELLKHTKIGFFIQGGYKFAIDSTGKAALGGEADQSKEAKDHAIFRTKGSFGIDTKSLVNIGSIGIGIAGTADGWYDFLNSEVYYALQGKARFYLTKSLDRYFEFNYQKGSGAPNFNKGDQFGFGLTITF
ncbi:MAG: hypothetical protein HXX13_08420 [Bacteroidetes bacterium]|nr:hypothetical protein [Bacteroidota bacterium]